MNPYWQTFSSPKNTVMSSHSAVWSQLRLLCACFLSLPKRYKGWCLTWGCQGHASMAASHACVHSHVGNTPNHVRRNKHYRLNALQDTQVCTHSICTIILSLSLKLLRPPPCSHTEQPDRLCVLPLICLESYVPGARLVRLSPHTSCLQADREESSSLVNVEINN